MRASAFFWIISYSVTKITASWCIGQIKWQQKYSESVSPKQRNIEKGLKIKDTTKSQDTNKTPLNISCTKLKYSEIC